MAEIKERAVKNCYSYPHGVKVCLKAVLIGSTQYKFFKKYWVHNYQYHEVKWKEITERDYSELLLESVKQNLRL